jgi:hypothetical protein
LTTRQYIAIYQEAGFVVKELILELSKDALQFRKMYPDKFAFASINIKIGAAETIF